MAKYIISRILRSICSIIAVVLIIMIMVFQLMDKMNIFNGDSRYSVLSGNEKIKFRYDRWEDYGYYEVEYYGTWLSEKCEETGESFNEIYYQEPTKLAKNKLIRLDTEQYQEFKEYYTKKGYHVEEYNHTSKEQEGFHDGEATSQKELHFVVAYKQRNVFLRLWDFFSQLFFFDNKNYVQLTDDFYAKHVYTEVTDLSTVDTSGNTTYYALLSKNGTYGQFEELDYISKMDMTGNTTYYTRGTKGDLENQLSDVTYAVQKKGKWDMVRYIKFCKDPLNGQLCLMGSGTKNRYLLYVDNVFPYVHQNILRLNLGYRYSNGEDFFTYFIHYQGSSDESTMRTTTLPSGIVKTNNYNYHCRQFTENASVETIEEMGDYYTNTTTLYSNGMSMIGYSFIIGIIATIIEYLLGVPLGMLIALKKDSIWDKIGNLYIIFIMAVPSLAYIYIFSTVGNKVFHLPNTWNSVGGWKQVPYFILPMISLSLPAVASLMKWTRRYMIDQMTSDYVKFARSQGYSEGEIVRKFVLKNAIIPIAQGIPGSILGALTGAIITERVYNVPGMGKLLTDAIDLYDNGVIVGLSFFYAFLSIVSLILGDVLMTKCDPRISFSGGGRK